MVFTKETADVFDSSSTQWLKCAVNDKRLNFSTIVHLTPTYRSMDCSTIVAVRGMRDESGGKAYPRAPYCAAFGKDTRGDEVGGERSSACRDYEQYVRWAPNSVGCGIR